MGEMSDDETVEDSATRPTEVVVTQSAQKWCVELELDTDEDSLEKIGETSREEVVVGSVVDSADVVVTQSAHR